MKEYRNADEAQRLAETHVIPKWHPRLAAASIVYLTDPDEMKAKGRQVLAKVRKANPVEHHLTGHDIVMIVNGYAWPMLSEAQRLAVVDHELCHIEPDEGEEGETVYRIRGHDLEEFRAVVSRHGDWSTDITLFNEAQREMDLSMKWTEHEHAAYLKRQGKPNPLAVVPVPDQSATEGEFQAWVLDLAKRNGWLAYHTYDSRKSGPGFPDLILVKGGVMIAAELKSADVKSMSLDQARWLAALGCVPGVRAVVWQPCDAESIIGQLESINPHRASDG